jgi:hypothetical protein
LTDFSLAVQGDCYKDSFKEDDYEEVSDMMCEAGIQPDLIKVVWSLGGVVLFLSSSIMDG